MAKLTMKQLINTAKELDEVMGLVPSPPIEDDDQGKLEKWLKEAAEELQENDELTPETESVLKALEAVEATEEVEEIDLVKTVDETDSLQELKKVVKSYDEFKSLRGELTKYKTPDDVEDLKEVMFDLLEHEEEAEKKEPVKEARKTPSGKDEVPIPKKGEAKMKVVPAEKEEKKEQKKEPKSKEGVDHSKSNKAIVYLAWEDGEKDLEKLHKKVNENVKLGTIKSWTRQWVKGKALPAIAKNK